MGIFLFSQLASSLLTPLPISALLLVANPLDLPLVLLVTALLLYLLLVAVILPAAAHVALRAIGEDRLPASLAQVQDLLVDRGGAAPRVLRRHGLRVQGELPRRLRQATPGWGTRRLIVGAVRVEPEAGVHGEEWEGDTRSVNKLVFPAPGGRRMEGRWFSQGFESAMGKYPPGITTPYPYPRHKIDPAGSPIYTGGYGFTPIPIPMWVWVTHRVTRTHKN
jgi:hypothetical protein